MPAALDREIRLQKFADVLMKTGGDLKAAGAAAGVTSSQAIKKLREEASTKGLLEERRRRFVGQYDIEISQAVEMLLGQMAGKVPTKVVKYTNAKGQLKETESHYDSHMAAKTLMTMAGAIKGKELEVGTRLAELLGEALDRTGDRLERERLAGKLPVSLERAKARAAALAFPIKELKAAVIDVTATEVPATPAPATPGGSPPSSETPPR